VWLLLLLPVDEDEYYEVDDLEEIHTAIVNNDYNQVLLSQFIQFGFILPPLTLARVVPQEKMYTETFIGISLLVRVCCPMENWSLVMMCIFSDR